MLPLVRIYELATVISWTDDRVEIGYPTDSLDADNAVDSGRIATVRDFLVERVGHPVELVVRLMDQLPEADNEARTALELKQQRAATERRKRESEAREHPLTKMVVKTFGATIKEIKTDV